MNPPVSDSDGLSVKNLSVSFGGVQALRNVRVQVSPGEIHGVIGPNGAGKTTLFDVIAGVVRADTGEISLGSDLITRRSPTARARLGVRRTFQRAQVFGHLSVRDNLLTATEWRGGGGGVLADVLKWIPSRRQLEVERQRRVDEVLAMCELEDVASTLAAALPIGRARMVELGRAIIDEPRLLLLDEPTSGLDEVETERLAQIVRMVAAGEKCGVLLVEHDIAFIMSLSDSLTALNLGEVLADGPASDVIASSAVHDAYLGTGATT